MLAHVLTLLFILQVTKKLNERLGTRLETLGNCMCALFTYRVT